MAYVSMLFYWVSHHPFLIMLGFPPALVAIGTLLGVLKLSRAAVLSFALAGATFVFGSVNIFLGGMANAAFLNAFGVEGRAVIVDARETSSRLNEQPVWAYDAVVRTADGQDADTSFNTMTASLWPIRNQILIPPRGENFVVKYVPGFPRNIVIMTDLSPSGQRRLLAQNRAPVDRAERRLAASPDNTRFREDYRRALSDFLRDHREADPRVTAEFERRLAALNAEDGTPASLQS
ncbi:hypothetical protein ACETK8_07580 [Brevundimonas staleyi]|uniref:Uncharacterized protein n=1 Tax=Brevundimonas staleyi TaxID=74326 RepID=A0ABW0FNJ1_9CAUL